MIDRTNLPCALLTALLLALSSAGLAQELRTCADGAPPRASLGITSFVCHCTYRSDDSGETGRWEFDSEPQVLGIEVGGPAEGALEKGDWIVAIDGFLITTEAGGRRWSSLRPGKRVSLKVRRDGVVRVVDVEVARWCRGDVAEPRASTISGTDRPTRLPRLLPRGWLGIGLRCDCSVDAGGEFPRWTFHDAPRVGGVVPGSPADRAGIHEGDVLLAIDGSSLVTEQGGMAFSRIEPAQRFRLTLRRDGIERSVELTATEKP